MRSISEYSADVNSAIEELKLCDRKPESLYAPIDYAMKAGGKRLRPVMCLMSAESFGGEMSEAMSAAVGLEMFHNFTLLHDDVMDDSDTRRGRQTVHVKWDKNAAILSGDTMLSLAESLMMRVPDDKLRRVLEIFNRMSIDVYEGQALDMEYEKRESVSVDEYLEMVRLKTGALLGAAAEIGSLLGGADKASAEAMREYGEMLGIAFQIEDDRLDTYGDSSTFGKPIGGDINNAKKTYLLTKALSCGDANAEALKVAMALPAGDMRVKVVRSIYDKMHIREACSAAVASYSARALSAVKQSGLSDSGVEPFKILLDKLTGRKK